MGLKEEQKMVTTLEAPPQPRPRQRWNDVELPRNKRGAIKQRLSWEDKLRLLDPGSTAEETQERLLIFQNLFAYWWSDGIITRVNRGPLAWTALQGRITVDHIARHLLADRVRSLPPQWIGARSGGFSRFACIDVDNHAKNAKTSRTRNGEPFPSFRQRCRQVEDTLRSLGINPRNPREVLIQATPSGGRHYYVFFNWQYHVDDLAGLWQMAGLEEHNGQIEFYPKVNRALRLPFGHIPGRKHDPAAWIDFVDDYVNGDVWLFHFPQLLQKGLDLQIERERQADEVNQRHVRQINQATKAKTVMPVPTATRSSITVGRPPAATTWGMGLPRRFRDTASLSSATTTPVPDTDATDATKRFLELVEHGPQSFAEAEELMELGILLPGYRHAVLNYLATHLVLVRGLSADEATEILTTWALDARHQSKDIQADLQHGGAKVAQNIADLCRNYARYREHESVTPADDNTEAKAKAQAQGNKKAKAKGTANNKDNKHNPKSIHAPGRLFAITELDTLRPSLLALPEDEREHQAHFLLSYLAFAKLHGHPAQDNSGWEAAPAVNAVIRRWPGCHHMHYLTRMNAAEKAGLFQMVREKYQAPPGQKGRARTYRLCVPVVARQQWSLKYEDALALLLKGEPVEQSDEPQFADTAAAAASNGSIPCRAGQDGTGHHRTSHHRAGAGHAAHLHPACAGGNLDPRPRERPAEPDEAVSLPDRTYALLAALDAAAADEVGKTAAETVKPVMTTTKPPLATVKPTIAKPATPELTLTYNLPPATDHAAVDDRIEQIKQLLANKFPGRGYEDHPTWPDVAAMAKDPTYSRQHRFLLLNDPFALSRSEFLDRKQTIRNYRLEQASKANDGKIEPANKVSVGGTSIRPAVAGVVSEAPVEVRTAPCSPVPSVDKQPAPRRPQTETMTPVDDMMEQMRREGVAIIADLLSDPDLPRVVRQALKSDPDRLPLGDRKLRLSVVGQERQRRKKGLSRGHYGEEAAWYTRYSARGQSDPYSDPKCYRELRKIQTGR